MITKVGLNFTALENLTAPNITVDYTAVEFFNLLPQTAHDSTGGLFAYFVLGVIFLITYWYLADKTPLGDFKFGDLRALSIAFAIASSVGLMQIMTELIQSWMAVVFFLLGWLLCNVLLIIQENKQ